MIKGSKLIGRSVVDMDAAEKLGKVKEIIVQSDGERVAGFVVSHAENILGSGGTRRTVPASAMHAIGPDAITVHGSGFTSDMTAELDALPRSSDVIGHNMVTQSGRLLGAIDDILIDPQDGRIIGFTVGEGIKSKLENMFNADRAHVAGYVRADADLQVGNDLIVVPDGAFVAGDPEALESQPGTPTSTSAEPLHHGWTAERTVSAPRQSLWRKRSTTSGASGSADEVEGWIPGDFSQPLTGQPAAGETIPPAPVDPLPSSEPYSPNPDDPTLR